MYPLPSGDLCSLRCAVILGSNPAGALNSEVRVGTVAANVWLSTKLSDPVLQSSS